MKKKLRLRKRSFVAVVLASAGLVSGQKVYQYSADPSGEKDCGPVSAVSATTESLATNAPNIPLGTMAGAPAPPASGTSWLRRIARVGQVSTPQWAQRGGTINDASCLNRTPVYGVVRVKTIDDIQNALRFARANDLKVSIAGVRHSMGGQAFAPNAVILDMRGFNRMSLDEAGKLLTVESGATWHDIQNLLHPRYAVKAMQSTDIFTVGGSIAVNAHGMDHQVGALGRTIRSMRVMLPDGSIQRLSPTGNPELFRLVVGGYGLFGLILDVQLDVTDNVIYTAGRRIVDVETFPRVWENELVDDRRLGLFYGHLSTAPQSLLREMILYTYHQTEVADADIPPLEEVASTRLRRFVLNFSKRGSWPMRLKWFAEKHLEPRFESCSINRNQAMKDGEACLVSRNEPMHDSVKYLQNDLQHETDILQEYFIPRDRLIPFVDGLRQIVVEHDTNLLNASVRVVHPEDNFLSYAPTEMFSVVLYINQGTGAEDNARMARVTREIIDLTIDLGGRFFLPYQLHYSPEQLQRAYPEIGAFFAAKRRYDPDARLTNTFYERYAPAFEGQ